jgi:hypothetical protein
MDFQFIETLLELQQFPESTEIFYTIPFGASSNDSSHPSFRLGSRFFQTAPHWNRLMPSWRPEWRRTSPLHPKRDVTESEWSGKSKADQEVSISRTGADFFTP